jgi:lipopolysaccharide export system protein LptA
MKATLNIIALGAALVLGSVQAAHASENVQVDADSMEVLDTEHRTIFRGNVIATRPTDQISSSEMVVTTQDVKQTDGSSKSITTFLDATGGVTITTKSQTIKGQWAKFYIQEDRLEVGGSVSVVQGKNTVRGNKLTINLKTNHMVVSGGRVHGSFVPK